jgi:3-hydroxymyristoyl/3-hydroxydecanoyl-(acyl carrier protein) dehydratase
MAIDNRRFRLGPATVQRLLPHRPPMLFVDFVAGYERTPRPTLRGGRHISANDDTFRGHFPDFGIWPGVYTVEGLNQACNLLATISGIEKHWVDAGRDPSEVLEALRHVDQVSELKPPLAAGAAASLVEMLRAQGAGVGFSVAIDVRLTAPVFAGSRLDYVVAEAHADEAAVRYDVEALVDGGTVARGKLMLSRPRPIPFFPK